jgi:hypothetical protein
MSEKKMIRRSVASAIGIVFIIILASVIGDYMIYENNTISSLNSQVSQLNSKITNLQSRVDEFTSILGLGKSIVLSVSRNTLILPNSYALILSSRDSPPYAGYVSVEVNESTSPSTYVEVKYTALGVNYDNRVVVGTSGTEFFPVLPAISIRISVGADSASIETVNSITVTYYY